MNLKPIRQFDENDVINFYSLVEASGNAGELVEYVSWNPSADDAYTTDNLSPFGGTSVPRYVNAAKVKLATSGNESNVAGLLLVDVRQTDQLGRPLIYDAQRWNELNVVYSGQTVPLAKRGIFLVSGFTGTPGPGSGIGVSTGGNGNWRVLFPNAFTPTLNNPTGVNTTSLGRFLSQTGANGYAFAYLDVR